MIVRAFTAVEFDENTKAALGSLCYGLPGVRWVDQELMHLTLHFLGDVHIEPVREILSDFAMPQPFRIVLSGVGRFVSRSGGAIWAGVAHSQPLLDLHEDLARLFRLAGIAIEKRKFQPHVTFARVKTTPDRDVHAYLEQFASFRLEPPLITNLTLFESQLRPDGPVHIPLDVYDFS